MAKDLFDQWDDVLCRLFDGLLVQMCFAFFSKVVLF